MMKIIGNYILDLSLPIVNDSIDIDLDQLFSEYGCTDRSQVWVSVDYDGAVYAFKEKPFPEHSQKEWYHSGFGAPKCLGFIDRPLYKWNSCCWNLADLLSGAGHAAQQITDPTFGIFQ